MTDSEYIAKIKERIGGDSELRGYFEGHMPRFQAQLEMWHEFLDKEDIKLVYDFGTKVPFTSLYFGITKSASVVYGCVGMIDTPIEPIRGININLNYPPQLDNQADLVICTECLEHLPCNLYRTRAFLMDCVLPDGYLLLSFPLNGQNAKDYGETLPQDKQIPHGHLREFTEDTAREFYKGTGFSLVSEKITWTDAYGGKIMNVLLKKDIYG